MYWLHTNMICTHMWIYHLLTGLSSACYGVNRLYLPIFLLPANAALGLSGHCRRISYAYEDLLLMSISVTPLLISAPLFPPIRTCPKSSYYMLTKAMKTQAVSFTNGASALLLSVLATR